MKRSSANAVPKKNSIYLEINRLIIRQWVTDDYTTFAEINSDSDMIQYFPKHLIHKEIYVIKEKNCLLNGLYIRHLNYKT